MAHEDTEHNNLESVRGCPSENVSDGTRSAGHVLVIFVAYSCVCVRTFVCQSGRACSAAVIANIDVATKW